MLDDEIRDCVNTGLAAVLESGKIALEYFRSDMRVYDKRTRNQFDPVTEADRRIETLIRDRLGAKYPHHRIVGEEHGTSGEGEIYWLIDPIDGTRSFICGMPTWGTLLGLVADGRAVGGIVHQPFTGETWIAEPVGGARLLLGGRETPLRTRAEVALSEAKLQSTDPRMFLEPRLGGRYAALAARCRMQRWGGDCYGYALVASGGIDLMLDGMLAPYDIAALIPIIEGAGGVVTDIEGQSALRGGTVLAAANARLHAEALAILNRETA
jgi:myo-inositol-1(or 4)-monophosphatase